MRRVKDMLRTYVFLRGAAQGVEVHLPPAGQTVGTVQQGRRVHLWWNASELEKEDLPAFQALTDLVPGIDHVVVGRGGQGRDWEQVLEAVVVECGADGNMVQVTAQEVHRPQPSVPPQAPAAQAPPPVMAQGAQSAPTTQATGGPGGPGAPGFFTEARNGRNEAAQQ